MHLQQQFFIKRKKLIIFCFFFFSSYWEELDKMEYSLFELGQNFRELKNFESFNVPMANFDAAAAAEDDNEDD